MGTSRRFLPAPVLFGTTVAELPGIGPVQVGLSFYVAAGGVVHEALERFGHPVRTKEGARNADSRRRPEVPKPIRLGVDAVNVEKKTPREAAQDRTTRNPETARRRPGA